MTQPSPSSPRLTIRRMVEDVVGCKWTLHVLAQVRAGVNRPGQLVRSAEGLTTKVLNERLVKLVRYGVLERHAYPEIPPRVEYQLTELGRTLTAPLDALWNWAAEHMDTVTEARENYDRARAALEAPRPERRYAGAAG